MKVYIANNSKQQIGGGWTFLDNLKKGLSGKVEFVDNWRDCDIYFIASSSMVSDDKEVKEATCSGKKIVLRVDNLPRNSRNRNTGTSRLLRYSNIADLIIYQSNWAKDYISNFTKKDGIVIYNGVDTELFNPNGAKIAKEGSPQYLYLRFNRDETKRWDEAWYEFQGIYFRNPNAHLWIVGNFSSELTEYNFDFFGGAENRYKFWGIINNKEFLAQIYRSADILLIPYFNDACSNTLLEGIASGLKIETCLSGLTGGTKELLNLRDISLERMTNEYLEAFKKLL